jgi:TetR/AcrR family transcriptional repressor of nem operon
MPRTKAFDPDRALARAMAVFWRLGYDKTSTAALMKAMGIARQSLYDTFGDKRALYLKALAYYRDKTNADAQRLLETAPSVKEGFAKLLFGIAAETREQHERGCLLLSANLERDTRDAILADFLRDNKARVEAILADTIRHGQARGELSPTLDPSALAHFFVVTIQGMRSSARLTSDRQALEQVARVALAVFSEGRSVG